MPWPKDPGARDELMRALGIHPTDADDLLDAVDIAFGTATFRTTVERTTKVSPKEYYDSPVITLDPSEYRRIK